MVTVPFSRMMTTTMMMMRKTMMTKKKKKKHRKKQPNQQLNKLLLQNKYASFTKFSPNNSFDLQTKPAAKPSAAKDDDDDDDDDEEESAPRAPLKSALKQPSSTPAKSETKSAPNPKPATPAADKPLNKTQLFINSIKESVSVSDLKALYPKATTVKMQKRKVGPNKRFIQ